MGRLGLLSASALMRRNSLRSPLVATGPKRLPAVEIGACRDRCPCGHRRSCGRTTQGVAEHGGPGQVEDVAESARKRIPAAPYAPRQLLQYETGVGHPCVDPP